MNSYNPNGGPEGHSGEINVRKFVKIKKKNYTFGRRNRERSGSQIKEVFFYPQYNLWFESLVWID